MSGKAETVTERMKSLFKIPPLQIICGLPCQFWREEKSKQASKKAENTTFKVSRKKIEHFSYLSLSASHRSVYLSCFATRDEGKEKEYPEEGEIKTRRKRAF